MLYKIHHNDEAGVKLYSVCDPLQFEYWLDSFKTIAQAEAYVKKLWGEASIVCSIRDCKQNHLTDGVPDNLGDQ